MTNTSSTFPASESGADATATDSLLAALADVDEVLGAVVGGLDPAEVQLQRVTEVWQRLGHIRRLADSGQMLLNLRLREADQWKREGFASLAEWMAHQSGGSVGRERSKLETSDRLRDLPDTADELRKGGLSAEQAEKITDAAKVNPDAEADLIDAAKKDPFRKFAEDAARRKAEAESVERRARRIRKERSVRHWTDGDGAFHLHAKGPAGDGGVIVAALERLIGARYRDSSQKNREGREAYAFDALVELASPTRSEGSGRSVDPTHLALIRADLAALVRGSVEPGEVCEIAGIGPIAVSEARALLGRSVLKLVMTRGVDVANVTHLGRGPSAAQEIALLWGGRYCMVEGCGRPAREVDHRIDFALTQHTRLDESDPGCEHHHDLKTYKGWAFVKGTGVRPFVSPDDPRHPGTPEQLYAQKYGPPGSRGTEGEAAPKGRGSEPDPEVAEAIGYDGQLFTLTE